jgi:hypothetical protein
MNKIVVIFQILWVTIKYPSQTTVFLMKAFDLILDLIKPSLKENTPMAADFEIRKVGDGEEVLNRKISLWVCPGEGNPINRAKELSARLRLSYTKEKMIMEMIQKYEADPSTENLQALIDVKNNYVEPNPDAI